MVIEELILRSSDQVVVRVTREVLRLFKVRIVAEERARHEAAREKTSMWKEPRPEHHRRQAVEALHRRVAAVAPTR